MTNTFWRMIPFAAVLAFASIAHAESQVCNAYGYVINVVIGTDNDGGGSTGWYTLQNDECLTLPVDGKASSIYYVYGRDTEFSAWYTTADQGGKKFCIDNSGNHKFSIRNTDATKDGELLCGLVNGLDDLFIPVRDGEKFTFTEENSGLMG